MKIFKNLLIVILIPAILFSCQSKKEKMEKELKTFIDGYLIKVKPLYKESNLAYFNATVSGKDEDFKKSADLNIKLTKIYTNKADFAKLKEIRESKLITDPVMKREVDVLYNEYLSNQIDTVLLEKIINKQTEVEKKYSNFRAEVNGKKYTDNEVEDVLGKSVKSDEVKDVWLAHKKIGPVVAADIKELVKMRNESARTLGFKNYHEMSLKLSEQDPEQIARLFDDLDNLTRASFAKEKDKIDEYLAKKFKIDKSQLMPWHYQNRFFQEGPKIYNIDLDTYYKDKDVVELTKKYYAGLGLNADNIIKNSDLYEKPGKNQHAYSTDIDKAGDIRILCNVKNNYDWMGTMLHETGHSVYDYYMPDSIPYILKDPAHIFTTEAIAMMFGRFASNPQWIKDIVGISEEEKAKIGDDCYNSLRLEQLVFSRWAQVMYHFEKKMYENPDQDLNKLWWDMVEKYQMIKRPADRNEPDWATKIHIATSPCYYHNYLLGELLASQLYTYITTNIIKSKDLRNQSWANNKDVGKFLKDKIFAAANLYYWDDMIEKATGEKLTPKYYAKQFVE
ncbi:MAG: M2 family metallopeptidase [Bacteroidia bacterium]|nr:M2 family metallopeptidase [Bacteroidia bacterium]